MKKVWNRVTTLHSPFFSYFKKHKCPNCEYILSVIWKESIVNPKAKDSKKYNFSDMDGISPFGLVKVKENQFLCENCKNIYTVDEIKNME